MKPSSNDGSNNMQRKEHSAAHAASNREEEMAELQQYYDQNGINVTVMPNRDYFLPRYVDHTYRDFSNYIKEGNRIEKHKKCDRNFPALLHTILSNDQYSHIISWMPHGRAWKIHDKDLLMEEVVPEFFGQSKYASFARQLSGWGFKRLHQTGADFGCYYHECFLRGHPKLTILMRRVSPGQGKVTPNMNAEPDFYSIAEQFPLGDSADVDATNNGSGSERVLKRAGASFSESEKRKTQVFGLRNEALGYKDGGGDPLLNSKAAAMERMPHQHHWDPFDQPDAAYPPYHEGPPEAAVKNYDGNSINNPSRSKEPVDGRSDDGKTAALSDQEASKYDPLPYRQPQPRPISYSDRGYSDPFPTPTYLPHSNVGYAMHPSHHEYYRPGTNINQYAYSGNSSNQQHVAAAAAAYYYPPPHYPHHPQYQHQNANGTNMPNYDYWYRNQYYGAQGLDAAQGHHYPQPRVVDTNSSQLQHSDPREAPRHQNSSIPPPSFSPLRSLREDENETNQK